MSLTYSINTVSIRTHTIEEVAGAVTPGPRSKSRVPGALSFSEHLLSKINYTAFFSGSLLVAEPMEQVLHPIAASLRRSRRRA